MKSKAPETVACPDNRLTEDTEASGLPGSNEAAKTTTIERLTKRLASTAREARVAGFSTTKP